MNDKKFEFGDILMVKSMVEDPTDGTSEEEMFWIGLLIEFDGQEALN